jgi:membrane protease YdiL (CAAX protease family)
MWAAMSLVLATAVARARAWHVLGAGHWKAGRIVGVSLACVLGLRIALAGYTLLWPAALEGELGSFPSLTRQLGLALLQYAGPAGLIAALAVLVPVLEELLFRGILLQGLTRHIPFGWANMTQAFLFAAVHENFRLFPYFVLFGVICGILARRSGGLLASISLHAVNNLLVCIGYIATQR